MIVVEALADQRLDRAAARVRIHLCEGLAQHNLDVIFQAGQKRQPSRLILAQVFGQFFVGRGQKLEDARRAVAGHAGKRQARQRGGALTHEVVRLPVFFERSRAREGHAMHQEQAGKGKFGILRSQFATQKPVQGTAGKEGNCRDQSNRNNQADNHK